MLSLLLPSTLVLGTSIDILERSYRFDRACLPSCQAPSWSIIGSWVSRSEGSHSSHARRPRFRHASRALARWASIHSLASNADWAAGTLPPRSNRRELTCESARTLACSSLQRESRPVSYGKQVSDRLPWHLLRRSELARHCHLNTKMCSARLGTSMFYHHHMISC